MSYLVALTFATILNVAFDVSISVGPPIVLFQAVEGFILASMAEDLGLMSFADESRS